MSDDINTAVKLEKPLSILHLEDVPEDAELVQAVLESDGIPCEITWVKTRNEFENALRTNQYDLILSDYALPDYDGLTALRLVKAQYVDTPFIFISGTMGEDAAIQALTEGGTDYVLKHNLARLAPAIRRELVFAETRLKRKQAEDALRESETRLSAIFKNIPTGLFIVHEKTRIIYEVNDFALETIGLPREDVVGKVCHRFLCPAEMGSCPICDLGQVVDRSERVLLKPDGTRVPILKTVVTITLKGENYFLESFIDITERKRAEEALKDSEERYATLFRGAAEGILIADMETMMFVYANPAICRMLGYSEEELTHRAVQDIHPAESLEYIVGEFQAQARNEKSFAEGLPCRRKDGSVIFANVNASDIVLKMKHYNVGFFTDITERKRAEDELQRQLNELQRWHAVTVDREDRVIELKKEVNDLLKEAGRPAKYGE